MVLQAIQQELDRLAVNLMKASKTVNGVMKQVNDNFPGPMLNSTLEGIKQQVGVVEGRLCCRYVKSNSVGPSYTGGVIA